MSEELFPLSWHTTQRRVRDLVPLSYNPRILTDEGRTRLLHSLKKFNLVEIPAINLDDVVLAGHQRLAMLIDLGRGDEIIDVRAPNRQLTKDELDEYNVTSNVGAGVFDYEALLENFSHLNLDFILDTGSLEQLASLSPVTLPPAEEGEFDPTPPAAPVSVLGDLYELNGHRLHCADSTDSDAVAKLLNGQQIDICFTSPPYNQGGGGMVYDFKVQEVKSLYKHKDDKRSAEEYFQFLVDVLRTIYVHCTEAAPVLWNVAYNANARDDYGRIMFAEAHGFSVRETIVWDKCHGYPIASRGILSRRAEFVFLLCKGAKYFTNQGRQEPWFNYWSISSIGAQTENHAAAFPVGLPLRGIEDFSPEGALVFEPFCGTGTTMVAAERAGRRCYAQEFYPEYCDVTVRRFIKFMRDNHRPFTITRNGEVLTDEQLAAFAN